MILLPNLNKLMRSLLNILLYSLVLFSFENRVYSLSETQIKEICKNKLRRSNCIKNLKLKKLKLLQGKRIEIPVIPFKN